MKQGERLKAMAPTHTQSEVSFVPGITSKTLKSLAAPCCFTFKRSNHGGYNAKQRKKELEVRDAKVAPFYSQLNRPLPCHNAAACTLLQASLSRACILSILGFPVFSDSRLTGVPGWFSASCPSMCNSRGTGFASAGAAGLGSSLMAAPKRWSNGPSGNSSATTMVDMTNVNNAVLYPLNAFNLCPFERTEQVARAQHSPHSTKKKLPAWRPGTG